MKKSLISGLFMALCALAMVSCQKEENGTIHKVFKASTESSSKTQLSGLNVHWQLGDEIMVISESGSGWRATRSFTTMQATGINNQYASFEGDVTSASTYTAIYPSSATIIYGTAPNEDIYTDRFNLPARQTAVNNSFDPNANLMIATTTAGSDNFSFKNICAYLKVQSPYNCSSIQIISNGTRKIAGTFDATVASDGTVSSVTPLSEDKGGSKYVRLSGNIQANHYYYIAVLPGTLDGGFTIKFWNVSGDNNTDNLIKSYNTTATSSITLERKMVYTLDGFTNTPENHIIPEDAVDLDLPSGTLWASKNVGATIAADNGLYFQMFGEDGYQQTATNFPSTQTNTGVYIDMANNQWGNPWYVPTRAQFLELLNSCTWTWGTSTNTAGETVNGYTITGDNGNSIFLPAAGSFQTATWSNTFNRYWTMSTGLTEFTTTDYYYFYFTSTTKNVSMEQMRFVGYPVRPVVNEAFIPTENK